ncbi:MAG: Endo-1,4-beta-xylanase A precursor [Pelotomaculum sp. PtaB.Bin104]|nr:MAG: Endo-1,4-beta-xylanase A precursor [Pelotomaculum sp. PtaB.Bin104]
MLMKRLLRHGLGVLLFALLAMLPAVFVPAEASAAGTTSLTITKLASDGTTVLAEETVTYDWLMDNLPVMGDGSTHYYHQGPVFIDDPDEEIQEALRWNPEEDTNVETKDMGAVMGTNVKDLCELVGGMEDGDTLQIKASDGFKKSFAYKNVYEYSDREGPMVVCWYKDGEYPDGGYNDGMRLVWFADTSVNPWEYHVFGNWDWHEAAAPEYWYYYQGEYPTTTGLSVQFVSELIIYSTQAPPAAPAAAFTADKTSGNAPLTVQFNDQSTNAPTSWAWDFNNDGTVDSTDQSPSHEYSAAGTYSVKLTVTNAAGSDDEVKTGYITVSEPSTIDVLYDGTVTLTPGETFDVTAYNSGVAYTVNKTTPLGALHAAATANGFTFGVTDKNYGASGALLLDNVGNYIRKAPGYWYAYVNDVYKDGYNNAAAALNLMEIVHGDRIEFYYAAGISDPANLDAVKTAATAAVKTVVSTGVTPTDWTLQLSGAKEQSINKAYFEDGLACSSSGHQVFWTDGDGNVWGGVPLWLLVAMVDDDPDVGPDHFNFNDDLASQNYEVNVIAGDGWSATLDSASIARNDGYIIANTLNGEPLPLKTESGKDCWPLYLKGSAVFGGQQVGNIVRIELSGLPGPSEGWTLEMLGEVGDTITQEEFEAGLACTGSDHYREWTDIDGNIWSGVPLWVLLGAVDDIETSSHWTFNDALAAGYTVNMVAEDGYTKNFAGTDVAKSDNYIVANKMNGAPLTESWPLRLVGAGVIKDDGSLGGRAVGNIVKIEIPELKTPPAETGYWNLALTGKISDVISQAEFEAGLACPNSGHLVEWTDIEGNVWSGIPLWFLTGWIDDRQPHNYNSNQAMAGYSVLVKAGDGYTKEFNSTDVAWSNDYIIANKCNGEPLTESWPLRLVGAGVAKDDGSLSGTSVGNIVEIELTSFETVLPVPEVRVIKYAEDGTTILNEVTVDYLWMQENLDVIGDGTTEYRYEAITNNPDDVWDAAETYPGGYKIVNSVKGTRIKDLCDRVGGMGAGTEIVLVAKDGYETRLPYSSIYTNPAVQVRQGDAILAWWGDGKYVPNYADGMRLFFTPGGDNVYGQWDMHETLPSNYWHYYYSDGVQYPSCAGLAAKWITEIKIYSAPESDWTLELDGQDIGGIDYDVSKTYFEQALACQFGANHKATYTDAQGQVWEGMPLWFLVGFVDDADQHSDSAFNEELAEDGYQVVITAADGKSVAINSVDMIRSGDYIIANSLNGAPIPESDSNWPLRLVGSAISRATSISQIVSIKLVADSEESDGKGGSGRGGNGSAGSISITTYSKPFVDILGHWAQKDIELMASKNIVKGVGDSTFLPDNNISRAEFASLLVRALDINEAHPVQGQFADVVPGEWYYGSVEAAAAAGLVKGLGDNQYAPMDLITREQMAVMIVRALAYSGVNTNLAAGEQEQLLAGFSDKDQISAWSAVYLAQAVKAGLINGTTSTTMEPESNASRAQATVMIKRMMVKAWRL